MTPNRLRLLANLIASGNIRNNDPAAWAADLRAFANDIERSVIQAESRIKGALQAARDTARDAG